MPKPLNGEFYTKDDDALMLTTPNEWPRWPYLPLKKSISEVGFCYGDPPEDGRIVVYLGNMMDPMLGSAGGTRKSKTYASANACVDDGWKVD